MFPLKNYKYNIPTGNELGAFGVTRRHDMHTGVDLYCQEGDEVYAIENGVVISIEWFTGPSVGMPWWNDTKAIGILGASGVINYGEVKPDLTLNVGDDVEEGQLIGWVVPVLKQDKGKVPSTSMLHVELYTEYNGEWVLWEVDTEQPNNLLNPTQLLLKFITDLNQCKLCKIKKEDVILRVNPYNSELIKHFMCNSCHHSLSYEI